MRHESGICSISDYKVLGGMVLYDILMDCVYRMSGFFKTVRYCVVMFLVDIYLDKIHSSRLHSGTCQSFVKHGENFSRN